MQISKYPKLWYMSPATHALLLSLSLVNILYSIVLFRFLSKPLQYSTVQLHNCLLLTNREATEKCKEWDKWETIRWIFWRSSIFTPECWSWILPCVVFSILYLISTQCHYCLCIVRVPALASHSDDGHMSNQCFSRAHNVIV